MARKLGEFFYTQHTAFIKGLRDSISLFLNPKIAREYDKNYFTDLLRELKSEIAQIGEKGDRHTAEVLKFFYNNTLIVLNGGNDYDYKKLKKWCEERGYTFPTLPAGEFEILD